MDEWIKKVWCIARYWWLTPVILAIWEAEIWRIAIGGQRWQMVHGIPSPK
jgi:hypothetical protein